MRKLKKGRARRFRLKWFRRGLLKYHGHRVYHMSLAMLRAMADDLLLFEREPK